MARARGKWTARAAGAVAVAVAAATVIAAFALPFRMRHDISEILARMRSFEGPCLGSLRTRDMSPPPNTDSQNAEELLSLLKEATGGEERYENDSIGLAIRGRDLMATGKLPFHWQVVRVLRALLSD